MKYISKKEIDNQIYLASLKLEVMKGLARWREAGKKVGLYLCNHCKRDIPCRIPAKGDVSSKGYWDSATTCIECGKMNFVYEWPSGRTLSKKMGE